MCIKVLGACADVFLGWGIWDVGYECMLDLVRAKTE